MSEVEYPAMRREVLAALAALSDGDYQQRVWIEKEYPHWDFYDDLDQNIHILYDDCQVLPDPESRLWTVLLPGDEIQRLQLLGQALGPLLKDLGNAADAAYLGDSRWPAVRSAAGSALASMVLAGGYGDA